MRCNLPGKKSEFGNEGGYAVSESLWVSWKNRILGIEDSWDFDPLTPRIPKLAPDPTTSYALRTQCARADQGVIAIHGAIVPDLVGDCVAVRLGNMDRIIHASVRHPSDPSHRYTAHTRIRHANPDRDHVTHADIGSELV